MTRPVENCPQPGEPIRERAWTAEQVERAAGQLCVRSRDDLDAERMLRAYAATLRQQGGMASHAEVGRAVIAGKKDGVYPRAAVVRAELEAASLNEPSGDCGKLAAAAVISDELRDLAVSAFFAEYKREPAHQWRDYMKVALEAVAPLLRAPAESPCSLSEALNVIEQWGVDGNTLDGDDVGRFRALADKIAPAERGGMVDEAMVDRYLVAQKETIDRLDRQWGTNAGGSNFVREACKAGLQAALAQNPQTLGDFVRLPDADREAIGLKVAERATEMQKEVIAQAQAQRAQNAQGEALTNEDAILKAIDLDPDSVAQQFAQNAQGDEFAAAAYAATGRGPLSDDEIEVEKRRVVTRALTGEKAGRADGWISVTDRLPECDMTPNSFGVPVEVKPGFFDGVRRIRNAFYGCRQTDRPNFYLYGAVFYPTHWRYPASPAPDKEG